jgi:hypothetical protein
VDRLDLDDHAAIEDGRLQMADEILVIGLEASVRVPDVEPVDLVLVLSGAGRVHPRHPTDHPVRGMPRARAAP